MRRTVALAVACFCCAFGCVSAAQAQGGRGGAEWTTGGNDAQRSSWVRTDAKISIESMQKSGFQFLWKLKLESDPKGLNSLTQMVLLDRYIGYRGFRALSFIGGSSDNIIALDSDLGRVEWQNHYPSGPLQPAGSPACPGGLTATPTRPTSVAPQAAPAGRAGGLGRGRPARSGVGQPGEGAITLAEAGAARTVITPTPPVAARPSGTPVAPGASGSGGYDQRRRPTLLYALTSDGMLQTLYVSNGTDAEPPVRFLPANANARGLIVVDNVAYAVTSQNCGGAADGVWALDLVSKQVSTWKPDGGGICGSAGPAFSPDGTLYVTAGDSMVALEPKTLERKDWYSAGKQEFTSSPVIFEFKERILIAATTKDGRMHLLDSTTLGGSDHQTPLYRTPAYTNAADFVPGALASWQDLDGTRWVLAPAAGPISSQAGFTVANGSVTNGALAAWKVMDQNGALTLQPGWVSRDLVSPLPPMVINGVVFALSSGEFRSNDSSLSAAQRAQRSSPAVLYALDGTTGKELWNSGKTIASFVHSGGLSGGGSQIYLGTYDGMLYAFGFPMEH